MKDRLVVIRGWGEGRDKGEYGYKTTLRILELIELLSILTVVVNTQTYTCDKLYRTKYTHIQTKDK